MTFAGELAAAWRLTRPRQWPILTCQLVVGMILAQPRLPFTVVGGEPLAGPPAAVPLAAAWLAWVVLLNGGTLAFNSAYDRDTGPVAYLARPPVPPGWLAAAATTAMLLGCCLAWFAVSPALGVVIGVCTILSVLYSHPRVRWKSRPGLDLMTNMLGYGAGTSAAGLLAGLAARGAPATAIFDFGGGWFCVAFGLLFGSFYPLTQLYQAEADRARGDRTLATFLGRRRALELAMVLGVLALPAFVLGLIQGGLGAAWPWPTLALAAWLTHLAVWRWRPITADAAQERAMYMALGLWAAVDAALVLAWLL